jgi:hypothetical protein
VIDSNVFKLAQPATFSDLLTEVLRNGARTLLVQAAEAEVADFLAKHADLKTAGGRRRVVRHGHLPEREIMTGIGAVAVRQPRVRDREVRDGAHVRFAVAGARLSGSAAARRLVRTANMSELIYSKKMISIAN